MKELLYRKEFYEPIGLKDKKFEKTKAEEWKKLSRKVVNRIRQWVDISVLHHVANRIDAYNLLTKLEALCQ